MKDLEILYPDVFPKRKRKLQDEFLVVTKNNFFDFCKQANRQFEYLLNHEHKSAMYFIDWRVNFSNVYRYIREEKSQRRSIFYHHEMERFLYYYEASRDLVYQRTI